MIISFDQKVMLADNTVYCIWQIITKMKIVVIFKSFMLLKIGML